MSAKIMQAYTVYRRRVRICSAFHQVAAAPDYTVIDHSRYADMPVSH